MRVAVAMSGGVDSTVAAALLVEAGHEVVGITMRLVRVGENGIDPAGPLRSGDTIERARAAADALGIEHSVVDLADEFEKRVVAPFADAYAIGRTPNPCVTCNERVKFDLLLDAALRHGADGMATGHYARLVRDRTGIWLERACDRAKDQTYFLYRIAPAALERLLFPLGEMSKAEVRAYAAAHALPAAEHRESQEVCFCANHIDLVRARHPRALDPGPIVDDAGSVLGEHRGIARYTVGQRKRIGLAGAATRYQVLRIDAARNAIVVGPATDVPATRTVLRDAAWRLDGPAEVSAQVRYRSPAVPAHVSPVAGELSISFAHRTGPLAPGQSVVCYRGDRVVGGGIVADVSA
jgi:tRNA-specific 2-thiouridylase